MNHPRLLTMLACVLLYLGGTMRAQEGPAPADEAPKHQPP